MGLLVLRRVVLGVLGDVAELARNADALRDVAAFFGRQVLDLLLELLVPVGRENDFLQDCGPPGDPCTKTAGWADAPSGGGGWYLRPRMLVNSAWLRCAAYAGEPPGILANRGRRDPDAGRSGPDGRGQRPGFPAPGPPLRGRARLLGDGFLRRDRAPERADARLPARGRGRASARDPDLRLGACGDGCSRATGRRSRRRHRGHELRL